MTMFFENNNVIGLDTEYTPHRNPWKRQLCYITIGGLSTSEIYIISPVYFHNFSPLFYDWLNKEASLILCFHCLADLTVLVTNLFPNLNLNIFHFKVFDFYLFFKFLAPNFNSNSLKDWALRILNIKLDKRLQKTNWSTVLLTEEHIKYMVTDVAILFKFLSFLEIIEKKSQYSYWRNSWRNIRHEPILNSLLLDHSLIPIYLKMSLSGVKFNAIQYNKAFLETKNKLSQQLQEIQLTEADTRSAIKIEKLLQNSKISGMPICLQCWPRTPKSDNLQISKKALQIFLMKNTNLDLECVQWIQKFLLIKQNGTLLTNLEKYRNSVDNQHIYPNWNIVGAKTGRVITTKPNLNSAPRKPLFRKMFIASQNTVFIIFDYSMIEIVIIAALAQEPTMLKNLIDGKDLHIFLASKILNRTYESLMSLKQTEPKEFKRIRTLMKALNFGLLYGMGPETLWLNLLTDNLNYSREEVTKMHKTWHNTFSEIRRFHYKCKYIGHKPRTKYPVLNTSSYITSALGRICREADKDTTYFNFPIQATCADILKLALSLFYEAQIQGKISKEVFVRITAHDEIVFEMPTNIAENTRQKVLNIMLNAAYFVLKPQRSSFRCRVISNS